MPSPECSRASAILALTAAAGLALWVPGCTGKRAAIGTHEEPSATAAYLCEGGVALTAVFYPGTASPAPAPGRRPRPQGRARLTFDAGRTITLERTLSADGVRYAAGDTAGGRDSLIFWGKGNGALLQESGAALRQCVRVAPDPGGLPRIFLGAAKGFSIRYPADYTVDTAYRYQALGPGEQIPGVAFSVPASLARGTNLSADSHLSVETMPSAGDCTAARFLGGGVHDSTVSDAGTTYSFARRTDAGAGNRYQEMVYAVPGTSPCLAVRYLIHWTVLENYPSGTVTAFDRPALLNRLDAMRRTLVIAG